MKKLKSPGIITAAEYIRAERTDRLTLTDKIFCSYCQAPVEVRDPLEFHCGLHGRLELRMYSNPGYPAVPKETHGTMCFHFNVHPSSSFETEGLQTHRIAEYKGCPFCNRNLEKEPDNRGVFLLRSHDKRPDDLIEKKLTCPECHIDFCIEILTYQSYQHTRRLLRLKPEDGHLDFNLNALRGIPKHSEPPAGTREVASENDTRNSESEAGVENTDTQLFTSQHASQHKDVKGQIRAYFKETGVSVAKTGELLQAIGCSRVSLNTALQKLIEAGEIRQIQKGYYEFRKSRT